MKHYSTQSMAPPTSCDIQNVAVHRSYSLRNDSKCPVVAMATPAQGREALKEPSPSRPVMNQRVIKKCSTPPGHVTTQECPQRSTPPSFGSKEDGRVPHNSPWFRAGRGAVLGGPEGRGRSSTGSGVVLRPCWGGRWPPTPTSSPCQFPG